MSEAIRNIMEKDVYFAHEEDDIATVLRTLVDKKISGVPIVNKDMEVVGFISDGDIMKFIAKQDPRIIDMTSFITVWYDSESFNQKLDDLLRINVMELATTKIIAVQAERIIRLEDGQVVYDGDAHAPEAIVQPTLSGEAAQEEAK